MSQRRLAFLCAVIASVLLVVRVLSLPRIQIWATQNRVLSTPERVLIAIAYAAPLLIAIALLIGFVAVIRGQRQHSVPPGRSATPLGR